jgi:putative DNA primase/helicase
VVAPAFVHSEPASGTGNVEGDHVDEVQTLRAENVRLRAELEVAQADRAQDRQQLINSARLLAEENNAVELALRESATVKHSLNDLETLHSGVTGVLLNAKLSANQRILGIVLLMKVHAGLRDGNCSEIRVWMRSLAAEIGVSRNTVTKDLGILISSGVFTKRENPTTRLDEETGELSNRTEVFIGAPLPIDESLLRLGAFDRQAATPVKGGAHELTAPAHDEGAGAPDDALSGGNASDRDACNTKMPPVAVARSAHTIPSELTKRDQWVSWKYGAMENGRRPKKPMKPATGYSASVIDPTTWGTYDQAEEAVVRFQLDGVGFVFMGSDSLVGVDIDDCRDPTSGKVSDEAMQLVQAVDSYTEVSPSGTGLHIIAKGTLPRAGCNKNGYEIYSGKHYVTITGDHLAGTPTEVLDRTDSVGAEFHRLFGSEVSDRGAETPPARLSSDDQVLKKARNARNHQTFDQLWEGHWEDRYPSRSEADMALCGMLAYWCDNDEQQMDRLFRASGLMREKWDGNLSNHGKKYGEITIATAISSAKSRRKSGQTNGANPSDR